MKKYAPVLVRIGMSLVYLWFGISQLIDPKSFFGYLPAWAIDLVKGYASGNMYLIYLNGTLEMIFGTLLLLGLFTRLSALVMGVHIFFITLSLGYNEIAVRDLGLFLATMSVFLHGPDDYSLDRKLMKNIRKTSLKPIYIFDRD